MLLLLLACPKAEDSAETGVDASDPATVALAGACALDLDFGGFAVIDEDTETTVDGAVADAVVPITILEEIGSDGDCRLMRRNNPHCEAACDPGQTCDWEGECVTYPAKQDLGTVTLEGLVQPVEMEPVFPGNTYFNTSLPHPAMTPGELVTLRMPGGLYGPARLYGVAVDPLSGLAQEWVVEAGVDLTVSWDTPTASVVRSEIFISVNIDQHGASPGTLMCVFEDDGEGVVSGALLEELVSVGVTGFPSGLIERRTLDSAPAAQGCMDFKVGSKRIVSVDVLGFTPCTSDAECPDDLDCNEEFQICE